VTTLATAHAAAVTAALEALEMLPPERYRWMGAQFALPARIVRVADPHLLRRALIDTVRWRLYSSFFITGSPIPAAPRGPTRPRALSHVLAEANAGTGCLEPGWRFVGTDGDRLVVERDGLRLWVRRDELEPRDPAAGDAVAVHMPKDAPELSPGFYVAVGDRAFPAEDRLTLDRFYFNLREEGAVAFISHVTRRLNAQGLVFRAKVVDEPGAFDRCDSALLMFERRDRDSAIEAAMEARAALTAVLDAATPALTLPLAAGLALAEDPGGAESFGAHRCRLIAEAVFTAQERGIDDLEGRTDVVRERFAHAGISLDEAHRGPAKERRWP